MITFDKSMKYMTIACLVLIGAGMVLPSWLSFLTMISLAKGMVVLGLVVLMRMGLVSFGQGLYYCLGGYVAGIVSNLAGITDAVLILVLAAVASVIVSALLGLLLCRYREIFFAMFSMAFSMILFGLLLKTPSLGSSDGFNVQSPTFFGYAPEVAQGNTYLYVLVCVTVLLAALVVHRFLKSPLGFAGEAIRENEIRVEYLGVSPIRVIYIKYISAAVIAGVGGALTAMAAGHIDPEMAYWTTSGEFVFVALLGGLSHVAAPFLSSILFEMIRTVAFDFFPYTWQMILGIILLLLITFLPKGIWSLLKKMRKKTVSAPGRGDSPLLVLKSEEE